MEAVAPAAMVFCAVVGRSANPEDKSPSSSFTDSYVVPNTSLTVSVASKLGNLIPNSDRLTFMSGRSMPKSDRLTSISGSSIPKNVVGVSSPSRPGTGSPPPIMLPPRDESPLVTAPVAAAINRFSPKSPPKTAVFIAALVTPLAAPSAATVIALPATELAASPRAPLTASPAASPRNAPPSAPT